MSHGPTACVPGLVPSPGSGLYWALHLGTSPPRVGIRAEPPTPKCPVPQWPPPRPDPA